MNCWNDQTFLKLSDEKGEDLIAFNRFTSQYLLHSFTLLRFIMNAKFHLIIILDSQNHCPITAVENKRFEATVFPVIINSTR